MLIFVVPFKRMKTLMLQRRQWHPTPVLLPGKSHGWRSLVGCSPCGRWGSDMTEQLHFHFSLSWIEEGNGNPLQCSCLENPRDGGAWWAAVYGVAQSWTQLKRLSRSSSRKVEGWSRGKTRLEPDLGSLWVFDKYHDFSEPWFSYLSNSDHYIQSVLVCWCYHNKTPQTG